MSSEQADTNLDDCVIPPREYQWGKDLAEELKIYTNIAWMLKDGGLDTDPAQFIADMKAASPDSLTGAALQSLFKVINIYYGQLYTAHETIQARETRLREECERYKSEITCNRAIINELRNTVQVISNGGGIGGGGHGRRSKDPEKFKGDQKEAIDRQYEYTTWKSALRLCHAMDPSFFSDPLVTDNKDKTSERMMILHNIGCMGGKAYAANKHNIDLCVENPTDMTKWVWKTQDSMWKSLDPQYITINLKLEAGIKFDKLFQKNQPYSNFITEFHILSAQAEKTKSQQVEALKKKVSDEIAKMFATITEKPSDEDFEAWVEKGSTFAENLAELHHNQQSKGNGNMPHEKTHHPHPQPQRQALTTSQGGDAMDLDKFRLSYTKMTQADRDHCKANGLCYYCKDGGHGVMQCEKKKASDERYKNNSGGGYQGGGGGAGRGGGYSNNYNRGAPQGQGGRGGGFQNGRGNGRGGFNGRGGQGGRGGFNGGNLRTMETQDEHSNSAGQWVWYSAALPDENFQGYVEGSVAGSVAGPVKD